MICRGRDNASAAITKRKVMALMNIAAPVPSVLTTSPAKPGPMARAKVNCTEFNLTASSNSSGGTSSGTKLCQAAVWKPVAIPPTSAIATIKPGPIEPARYKAHRKKAQNICTVWVIIRILRRLMRSDNTPAYGVKKTAGKSPAIDDTPSQVELLVMS